MKFNLYMVRSDGIPAMSVVIHSVNTEF
jgi:hypothetical protein